jgi:hypothetical protein
MSIRIKTLGCKVYPGDPTKNYYNIIGELTDPFTEQADVIVLPELCLSGALIGNMWNDSEFIQDCIYFGNQLAEYTRNKSITLVFGNVFIGDSGQIFNGIWICSNGTVNAMQPKFFLNNSEIYNESSHFTDGCRQADDADVFISALIYVQKIKDVACAFVTYQDAKNPSVLKALVERDVKLVTVIGAEINSSYNLVDIKSFTISHKIDLLFLNQNSVQDMDGNVFSLDGTSEYMVSTGNYQQSDNRCTRYWEYPALPPMHLVSKSFENEEELDEDVDTKGDASIRHKNIRSVLAEYIDTKHVSYVNIIFDGSRESVMAAQLVCQIRKHICENPFMISITCKSDNTQVFDELITNANRYLGPWAGYYVVTSNSLNQTQDHILINTNNKYNISTGIGFINLGDISPFGDLWEDEITQMIDWLVQDTFVFVSESTDKQKVSDDSNFISAIADSKSIYDLLYGCYVINAFADASPKQIIEDIERSWNRFYTDGVKCRQASPPIIKVTSNILPKNMFGGYKSIKYEMLKNRILRGDI